MNTAHKQFLERMAAKAAVKETARHGGAPLKKEEFLRMRIQVIEPLMRLTLVVVGAFTGALAFWLHRAVENLPLTVFVGGIAVAFCGFAIIGRRESVENALSETAEFIYRRVID